MQPGDMHERYAGTEVIASGLDFGTQVLLKDGVERVVAWYRDYNGDSTPGRDQP